MKCSIFSPSSEFLGVVDFDASIFTECERIFRVGMQVLLVRMLTNKEPIRYSFSEEVDTKIIKMLKDSLTNKTGILVSDFYLTLNQNNKKCVSKIEDFKVRYIYSNDENPTDTSLCVMIIFNEKNQLSFLSVKTFAVLPIEELFDRHSFYEIKGPIFI